MVPETYSAKSCASASLTAMLFLIGPVLSFPGEVLAEGGAVQVKYSSQPIERVGSKASSPEELAVELNEEGVELVFQGEKEKGIAKIKQGLAQDPKNATILYNLSGLYLTNDEPEKAIPLLKEALEIHPKDLAFLNRLAEAYFASKELESAASTFERIIEIDPSYKEVLLKLGTLYGVTRQWEKAEQTLRRAHSIQQDDPKVLSSLGSILIVREQYGEALELLKRAHGVEKTSDNAMSMGVAAESLGDLESALKYYREAKQLGHTQEDLDAHLEEIQKQLAETKEK